jgi:hypothetical protein
MTTHIIYELNSTPLRLTPLGKHSGKDITLQNQGPDAVLIGGDDTLSGSNFGYKLPVDSAISFELPGGDSLYAITEGSALLSVLDMSLEQGE